MANYIIGFDFGTYQTKASITHLDKKPQKHEFFEFGTKKNKSFFLLSKVFLLNSGLIKYGIHTGDKIKHEFNYFKMASAEDEYFRLSSDISKPMYNYNNSYQGYSPELLSVLYITYVLLVIKEKYQSKSSSSKTGVMGGLFSGLRRQKTEDNNFIVRMGIPTEYSKEVNLIRRRKFETILLISEMLQNEFKNSLSNYLNCGIEELTQLISKFNNQVPSNEKTLESLLKEKQLSVFPESAAGLLYFVKSGKLQKRGLYAAMDIGGGTTDMSFFNVNQDGKIVYYSSESYMVACNNIYLNYNDGEGTLDDIKSVEQKIITLIKKREWRNDKGYFTSVSKLKANLGRHLKTMITSTFDSALSRFTYEQLINTLKNQPIIIYGGGLAHPQIKTWDEILLFDNGDKNPTNPELHTYMDIRDINLYKPDKTLILNKNWEQDFPFLIVAFGLSYLHHVDDSYWDDGDYKSIKLEKIIKEVPHPINEGMYIYKVIERRWENN